MDTPEKNLGKPAFQTYWGDTAENDAWEQAPQCIRDNWNQAASAVKAAVLAELPEWGLVEHPAKQGDQYFSHTLQKWLPVNMHVMQPSCPLRRRIRPSPTEETRPSDPRNCPKCGPHPVVSVYHGICKCDHCGTQWPWKKTEPEMPLPSPEASDHTCIYRDQSDRYLKDLERTMTERDEALQQVYDLQQTLQQSEERTQRYIDGHNQIQKNCIALQEKLSAAESHLSKFSWNPVSTPPAKEDGLRTSLDGLCVIWTNLKYGPWVGTLTNTTFNGEPATHWMRIPALPTPPSVKEDQSRKQFEEFLSHDTPPERHHDGTYISIPVQKQWRTWKAALKSSTPSV